MVQGGLSSSQRMAMRAAIYDIVGAPWKLLGRDRDGIDCLGMVLYLYGQAGINLPDPALSRGEASDAPSLYSLFRPLGSSEIPEIGDVVQFPTGEYGTHLCVYHDGNLLQATEPHGVVQVPFRRFLMRKNGVTLQWFRYCGLEIGQEAAA
jgi:cell wall-associated NlpC family hydrolase